MVIVLSGSKVRYLESQMLKGELTFPFDIPCRTYIDKPALGDVLHEFEKRRMILREQAVLLGVPVGHVASWRRKLKYAPRQRGGRTKLMSIEAIVERIKMSERGIL